MAFSRLFTLTVLLACAAHGLNPLTTAAAIRTFLLVLILTFPLAFLFLTAQQRIALTQSCADPTTCPLTLAEGFKTNVLFSLSQPIVCDASATRECVVVVLLTNNDPKSVAVNPCLVKWTSQDWFQKRTIAVQAVENYKNDGVTRSVYINTEPAVWTCSFICQHLDFPIPHPPKKIGALFHSY